ncbi:MAG: hypothetical protein GX303_05635 [Clostridiales bacterium]|nr:hypothetical protein [Clostridiales bacterium]
MKSNTPAKQDKQTSEIFTRCEQPGLSEDFKYASKGQFVVILLTGAFLFGTLWRIRGSEGFGSFWGMIVASLCFCLFVFTFLIPKYKTNSGIFGEVFLITVLSMAVTVGGWGTLNTQITGMLSSGIPFSGEDAVIYVPINPLSGITIMLCLGFGWMPFFAYCIGRIYSNRIHMFKQTLLAIAVYYIVMWLAMLLVSHILLGFLNPQATDLFSYGLTDKGYNISPWRAYISNFDNSSWAKGIPGGRNYFASISAISSAIASVALFAFVRYILHDKRASNIIFKICGVHALSITLADLWLFWSVGGFRMSSLVPPAWLDGWHMWEYFTGLFSGLGIMLILLNANRTDEICIEQPKAETAGKFMTILGFLFRLIFVPIIFIASIMKPLADNFGLPFTHFFVLFPLVFFTVLYGLLILIRRIKNRDSLNNRNYYRLFSALFLLYYSIYVAIYFRFADASYVVQYMMMITAVAVYLGYVFLLRNKSLDNNQKHR